MMRAGLVQLNVSDDPVANLAETVALVRAAAAGGADFVLTPASDADMRGKFAAVKPSLEVVYDNV